jgi:hypothetical protein
MGVTPIQVGRLILCEKCITKTKSMAVQITAPMPAFILYPLIALYLQFLLLPKFLRLLHMCPIIPSFCCICTALRLIFTYPPTPPAPLRFSPHPYLPLKYIKETSASLIHFQRVLPTKRKHTLQVG